jgi:hypothetical protein
MERGIHRFRTVCSDAGDPSLHDVKGEVTIEEYDGANPLYRRGPIRVAADRKHFEHADGTAFFWLGDTWWMGLTKRLQWPGEFETLTRDRVEKGFTVVQIVAGLYPDMPAFDERGANEAGYPWEKDYARINPAYFDEADKRLAHLADNGLAPCIVGAWGYHLPWLGVDKMKKHWRYVIARWGAYPTFWCVAGEGAMPYYMLPAEEKPKAAELQKQGWTEIAKYIREIDAFDRPITIHPTDLSRNQVTESSVLDFEMLQTGHGDRASLANTISCLQRSRAATPTMPTINSEVCYEGILGTCAAEVVRLMTWTSLLRGTAGHTYGANGIWQLNRREKPYGKSPHGGDYGHTPWDEAMKLPGSRQSGLAKKLLERFEWWKFEPNAKWAKWSNETEDLRWGDWIWHAADGNAAHDAPTKRRKFRLKFDLPAHGDARRADAKFHVTADDRFVVSINGKRVGESVRSGESWRRPGTFDLAPHLENGSNIIEIEAENIASNVQNNPAGLICAGNIYLAPRDPTPHLRSDGRWQSSEDGMEWAAVKTLAPYGGGPWGRFMEGDKPPLAAAGIANKVRVIYAPAAWPVVVPEFDAWWQAQYFDPETGDERECRRALSDDGLPMFLPPHGAADWVLVLTSKSIRRDQP